eukprot:14365627-Alexandrium_andersonii.AAC.1
MASRAASPLENFKLMRKGVGDESGSAFAGQLPRLGGISGLAAAAQAVEEEEEPEVEELSLIHI